MSDFTKEQINIMAEYQGSVDLDDSSELSEFIEFYLKEGEITNEPAVNFIDACREYSRLRIDHEPGCVITKIYDSQRQKGEPRCDLNIFDFGEFRVVFK